MTQVILFVALSVLDCTNSSPRRCTYDREIIMKAENLVQMESFKYKLGPMANTLNEGCIVMTKATTYYVGKTCRKIIGQ
jgi:hypothetical protein